MDRKARILVLDDSEADADLVRLQIRRRDLDCETLWVSDREGFLGAVGAFAPDIVLADYTIPGFSGMEALRIVRERLPEIPFIFVSGSIGEEAAVDALKSGATDYVLKGQLARLVPAVVRALRDMDDRADRRRLEQQFHQAQKMEAVGQLASGIAHDFNNLLTVISGYTELALARVPESDPLHSHLREVRSAGERAATLTRQLLSFGRKNATQHRAVCLDAVVANMDRLLRRVIGEDVTLATVQGSLAANVLGDNGQFEQVLMNLAVNARDAMPNGGKLTIETAVEDLGTGDPRLRYGLKPGRHVRLSVTDSGTGMDAATQSRIFEPFFTTKPEGKGTGLGLATVYGIVRQSGGCIFVDSEPGKGTTFRVYFPCADGPAEAGASPEPAARPKGGREKVLVV
jgi:two-component system cell cycle sensor histidine kinase/response regulator CckA